MGVSASLNTTIRGALLVLLGAALERAAVRIRSLAWVFRLLTAADKFYPDFVAKRKDGRILVVEYKGDDCISNDDSKEKKSVGALWEERCHDKAALFWMAAKRI
jgi:hypothetical protein